MDAANGWETEWGRRAALAAARYLVVIPAAALAIGAASLFGGRPDLARLVWAIGIAPVLLTLIVTSAASLWRGGEVGLDFIAALAMGGALAGGE